MKLVNNNSTVHQIFVNNNNTVHQIFILFINLLIIFLFNNEATVVLDTYLRIVRTSSVA